MKRLLVAASCIAVLATLTTPAQGVPTETPGCDTEIDHSIKLGADVTTPGGCPVHGLIVTKKGVTIDLNGFRILGNGGDDQGLVTEIGVKVDGKANVTVKNGFIGGFEGGVASALNTSTSRLRVSNITLRSNSTGISATGNRMVISKNSTNLGSNGIRVMGVDNTVAGNAVDGASQNGIWLDDDTPSVRGVVKGNTVRGGTKGILVTGTKAIVTRNTILATTLRGIEQASTGGSVTRNTVQSAVGQGIRVAGVGVKAVSNNVRAPGGSGIGIDGAANSLVEKNTVTGSLDGISIASEGVTVKGNVVASNDNAGILIGSNGAKVLSNRANGNKGDGIKTNGVLTGLVIKKNTASGNGFPVSIGVGFGINATGVSIDEIASEDNLAAGNDGPLDCTANVECSPSRDSFASETPACGTPLDHSVSLLVSPGLCTFGWVTVTKSNITIDLNGQRVLGNAVDNNGLPGNEFGVEIAPDVKNVKVKNGIISGFEHGIHANGGTSGLQLSNLNVRVNDETGILLGGKDAVISRSIVAQNDFGLIGFVKGTTVTGTVFEQHDKAIQVSGGGNIVRGNIVRDASVEGIRVYASVSGSAVDKVQANTVSDGGIGIFIGSKSGRVRGNTVFTMVQSGIEIHGKRGNVSGNTVTTSGGAISVLGTGTSPVIKGNSTSGNAPTGITVFSDSAKISGNVSHLNSVWGIRALSNKSSITKNRTFDNGSEGITVAGTGKPVIRKNIASGNGYEDLSPGVGLGITTNDPTSSSGNVADGNDDATECSSNLDCSEVP